MDFLANYMGKLSELLKQEVKKKKQTTDDIVQNVIHWVHDLPAKRCLSKSHARNTTTFMIMFITKQLRMANKFIDHL